MKCKNCGATLDPSKAENRLLICENCSSATILYKDSTNGEAVELMEKGAKLLETGDFDDALECYKLATKKCSAESEAYWGMALAEFKVQFRKDVLRHCLQPVCRGEAPGRFQDNMNYQKAMLFATAATRKEYHRLALEIDGDGAKGDKNPAPTPAAADAFKPFAAPAKPAEEKKESAFAFKSSIPASKSEPVPSPKQFTEEPERPKPISEFEPVERPKPVYETPVAEEPVYEEPVERPKPIYEEPVAEEPAFEAPVAEEPAYEEPIAEEPAFEAPVAEEPAFEEPIAEEPAFEAPVAEEPAYEEPIAEEPAFEEPVAEEPAYEEPIAEEPAFEEPVAEEPAYEEPVAEESAAETEPEEEAPAEEPVPAVKKGVVEEIPMGAPNGFVPPMPGFTPPMPGQPMPGFNPPVPGQPMPGFNPPAPGQPMNGFTPPVPGQPVPPFASEEKGEEGQAPQRDPQKEFEIVNGEVVKYTGGTSRVVIPVSVTSIKEGAFEGCKHISNVTIPGSVTHIGARAFANCHSLRVVFVPESVKDMEKDVFLDCSDILVINCGAPKEPKTWDKNWNKKSNGVFGGRFKAIWGYKS